jgi:hypothetical protein
MNKLATLEYLASLAEMKTKEYNDPRHWLTRSISYFKYWLKGEKAINFHLDLKNVGSEIAEVETHIQTIIKMIDGNIRILDECLIHFETAESRYSLVGREYCLEVLKSAKVRLRS